MKKRMILAVVIALSLVAGCGAKNSDIAESQKEAVTKTTDNKKAENQKKVSEESTEKSEETELKNEETVVKADEKAVEQQTSNVNTSDTDSSSNGNSVNNASSSNSTSGSSTGSATSSGSTGSGGSSSGGNSNSSVSNPTSTPVPAPAQPTHTHTWVHVDGTGHYETVTLQAAYDEEVPVYENVEHSICNQCKIDITGNEQAHNETHLLAYESGGWHSEWRYEQTGTQIIHHDAVTEQRYVQDTPEYDMCSGCGATKDCSCTR